LEWIPGSVKFFLLSDSFGLVWFGFILFFDCGVLLLLSSSSLLLRFIVVILYSFSGSFVFNHGNVARIAASLFCDLPVAAFISLLRALPSASI
jgi:hypothetical protein